MDPLSYDAEEEQWPQHENWTCSACSLAWLNRALGIDYATEEYSAAEYIGVPTHINAEYGLMDASGSRLAECLREQGAPALCLWPSWQQAWNLAAYMPLLIGGMGWYHWVGVRHSHSGGLHLANSAPGWMGVDQELSEHQWNSLGPFAAVAVPLLHSFPPPHTS